MLHTNSKGSSRGEDLTHTAVIALAITITENILHFDFRHARRFLSYLRDAGQDPSFLTIIVVSYERTYF